MSQSPDLFTPFVEAVDPALQAVAPQALHWLRSDELTCELRSQTEEPHLDGFNKPTTQLLGRIQYNPATHLHLGFIHHQPGLIHTPPAMHILSKYDLEEAKTCLLHFLLDIKRL